MMTMPKKGTIAERLDWLFTNIRHPSGREYMYLEIQSATEEKGRKVAASYIGKLRRGEKDSPAWDIVDVLAQVFNVPITFFYTHTLNEEYLERIKIATAIQVNGVGEIALRAKQLNPDQRKAILTVIDGMTLVKDAHE